MGGEGAGCEELVDEALSDAEADATVEWVLASQRTDGYIYLEEEKNKPVGARDEHKELLLGRHRVPRGSHHFCLRASVCSFLL